MGWDYDRNYRETRADKIGNGFVFAFAGVIGVFHLALIFMPAWWLIQWIAGLVGFKI